MRSNTAESEYPRIRIPDEINSAAIRLGRPQVCLIDGAEFARIRELIDANTWPQKWDGTEPTVDELLDRCFADGTTQPLLPILEDH